MKTVWYRHKKRHTLQWKRIESPEINPYIHGQSMTRQEYTMGKKDHFFNKQCWQNWIASYMPKNETGPFSYIIHKNKLKTD